MSVENKEASSFEDLLKAVQAVADDARDLAKSQADEDDQKVLEASEDDLEDDLDEDELEDEDLGEAVTAVDADGNETPAVDATRLVKSLIDRADTTEAVLAKSIGAMTKALAQQTDLIKSLRAEVKSLSGQGRGRKAVLSVAEKPDLADLAKSQAQDAGSITPEDLLVKSEMAWNAGKITGREFSTVDACLRNRLPIDPQILRKIALA